jgi:hypothetical protein
MATLILMTAAAIVALFLSHALQAFNILLQIGAGTGLLFLLRWFWWRVNAASEIAAMGISFVVAVYFQFVHGRLGLPALSDWQKLVAGVAVTTAGWILVTLLTRPSEQGRLLEFYRKVHPGGPGWRKVLQRAAIRGEAVEEYLSQDWDVPDGLLRAFLAITLVYAALFATGFWLYSNTVPAILAIVVALMSSLFLLRKGLQE